MFVRVDLLPPDQKSPLPKRSFDEWAPEISKSFYLAGIFVAHHRPQRIITVVIIAIESELQSDGERPDLRIKGIPKSSSIGFSSEIHVKTCCE
jgi:hypothetical protein